MWQDSGAPADAHVGQDEKSGVSSASLFLWRNIVSKVGQIGRDDALAKHNVAMLITNLNSFDPSSKKEHDMIDDILDRLCNEMQKTLQPCSEGRSPTILHMTQMLDAAVVPGSGVSLQQPFEPIRMTFPSATSTGLGEIEYTLGSESSDIFEALQIAVALLYSQSYGVETDVDEQENRHDHWPEPFFLLRPNPILILSAMMLSRVNWEWQILYCTYGRDQHGDSSIDFDDYCRFLGLDKTQHNKSGQYVFLSSVADCYSRSSSGHHKPAARDI